MQQYWHAHDNPCLWAGRFSNTRDWLLGTIILQVFNMTWPSIYTLPAKAWHLVGSALSKILLTLVFFIVLTPIALLRRALGHDPMVLKKWKEGNESVFKARDHTYIPEELEQPF